MILANEIARLIPVVAEIVRHAKELQPDIQNCGSCFCIINKNGLELLSIYLDPVDVDLDDIKDRDKIYMSNYVANENARRLLHNSNHILSSESQIKDEKSRAGAVRLQNGLIFSFFGFADQEIGHDLNEAVAVIAARSTTEFLNWESSAFGDMYLAEIILICKNPLIEQLMHKQIVL